MTGETNGLVSDEIALAYEQGVNMVWVATPSDYLDLTEIPENFSNRHIGWWPVARQPSRGYSKWRWTRFRSSPRGDCRPNA